MRNLLLIVFTIIAVQSSSQWHITYESDSLYGNHIDASFYSAEGGVVIGQDQFQNAGYILRTDDGGENWISELYPGYFFRSIDFPSSNRGYLLFRKNLRLGVLQTSDGGANWVEVEDSLSYINPVEIEIEFFNDSVGMIAAQGVYYRTTNGGYNWSAVITSQNFGARSMDISGTELTGATGSFLTYSSDLGETVDSVAFVQINSCGSISLFNGHVVMGCTEAQSPTPDFPFFNFGKVVVGNTPQSDLVIHALPFTRITHLEAVSEDIIYATCLPLQNPNGHFMKSVDGGHHWFTQNTMEDEPFPYSRFDNLSCVNDSVCYAAFGAFVYKTTNGGGFLIDPVQEVSLSVKEIKDDVNFSIAPNPTDGAITIRSEKEKLVQINVYDLQGKEVYSSFPQDFSATIDLQARGKGMYIIQVMAGDQIRTAKVVVE